MQDLAWSPPKSEKDTVPAAVNEDSDPQYPSLRFNGQQASKAGLTDCRFGEEYEITIRVKATRIDASSTYPGSGVDKDKPAVEFDVLACDEPQEVKKEEGRGPKVKGPKEAGVYSDWKKRDKED
jgi:hypothetical protein